MIETHVLAVALREAIISAVLELVEDLLVSAMTTAGTSVLLVVSVEYSTVLDLVASLAAVFLLSLEVYTSMLELVEDPPSFAASNSGTPASVGN